MRRLSTDDLATEARDATAREPIPEAPTKARPEHEMVAPYVSLAQGARPPMSRSRELLPPQSGSARRLVPAVVLLAVFLCASAYAAYYYFALTR